MQQFYLTLAFAIAISTQVQGRSRTEFCSSPDQTSMTLKSWYLGHANGGSGKWAECEQLCRDDPKCNSWMGRNSGNTCYLSEDRELKPRPSGCCHDHHPHTFNAENCAPTDPPTDQSNGITITNARSGRRLYAQSGKQWQNGVGAAGLGTVYNDQKWHFVESTCPTSYGIAAEEDTCYEITNAVSGRRLYAQSGKEWGSGVGAGVGTVYNDQKWILQEDDCGVDEGCFLIVNAVSGRRLYAQADKHGEEGVGAGVGTVYGDQKWFIDLALSTPAPTPNPTSAELSTPAVTFCEHYGCSSGFKWELDGPMETVWVGEKNDKISEIVIQKGWKLQVFEHSNFEGRSKIFEAQDSDKTIDLGRHNMNNMISSFKIYNPVPTMDRYVKSDGILGTSGAGGTCTCPSGETYIVADNYDGCQSLQCVGGISELFCNDPVTGSSNGYQFAAQNGKRGWGVVCGNQPSEPTSPPNNPTSAPTIAERDFDFVEEVPDMSQGDIVKVMNWIKAEVTMVKNPFCWKDTYGRGVGKIPSQCPGRDKIGALCYSKCPSGYHRFGFDCHTSCPSGSRNDGLYCRWAEYGRGAGFPWKFGDGFSDRGMYRRCQSKHGKGNCEKWGAIVYPKCRPGYKPFGCCICRPEKAPNCEAHGLSDAPLLQLSCRKKIEIGDPIAMSCPSGEEKKAGLCYPKCRDGFKGIGPVCWGQCDDSQVNCGAACAKSTDDCVEGVVDQVVAPLILAANVATLGLATPATAGASMTIKVGGKVVAGNTKLGRAFVWAVKNLQTTGKIKQLNGVDQFVLNGLKGNAFTVLRKSIDKTTGKPKEELKEFAYMIKDIVTGDTGTNVAKESYQAMRDYQNAFADAFAEQTSSDINNELDRNFHPSTARFLKETWAEYSLAEMAEAEGWETADTVLTIAAVVDITGVMGVVDAYAKPTCNAIVPFPSTSANLP